MQLAEKILLGFVLGLCVLTTIFIASSAKANVVSVFQNWNVSYQGEILGFNQNLASTTFGYYAVVVKMTSTSTNPIPLSTNDIIVCTEGATGGGGSDIFGFVGTNLFEDFGLGEGDCTAAGSYWLYTGETNTLPNDVQWAFRVQYDGQGVQPAQPVDGCLIGFDCPIISSTSTIGELTLECNPNEGFFSRSICAVGVFLFVPNQSTYENFLDARSLLMIRLPFSLFGEFRNTFLGINPASTTPISLSVVTWPGEEPVEILSTSTIDGIFGDYWSYLRTGIGLMLYLFFAWYLFFRVSNLLKR